MCVCVKTQQRTRTGPDHRQDTTANGRRRGPCVRTRRQAESARTCTPSATAVSCLKSTTCGCIAIALSLAVKQFGDVGARGVVVVAHGV